MAPPSSRRSGHSRRAQYGQFTGYVIAAIGAVIGAVLLLVSLLSPNAFSGLRGGAAEVVAPPGRATAVARDEGQSFIEAVQGYLEAGSQNATLRREVELARIRLAEAKALEQENDRLRALLEIADRDAPPIAVTRLVGSSAASTRRFAYIGAGSADGVQPGMPVRAPRGFVGRVLEVSDNTARVLLLTDSESVVPVRRVKDNVAAFAEGRGDGLINIRLINLGINPLKKGRHFRDQRCGRVLSAQCRRCHGGPDYRRWCHRPDHQRSRRHRLRLGRADLGRADG